MRKPGSASQDRRGGFDYRKDEINQTHEKVIRASETLESCNLIGKLGT
ncbi:unnamed protein product [Brassica rapa subsp. narinosa]